MQIPMLIFLVAALALTGCNNGNAAKPNDTAASNPATLQGESPHWRVKLNYVPSGSKLQEITVIENKIDENLEEVTVTIVRSSGDSMKNDIAEPGILKPGQAFTLQNKAEVSSWKDTEQVQIEWKAEGRRNKEYITVENKAAAAPTK